MLRATLWLALIGATVGPVLDGLHTFSGATWYPHPQWLRSVWWCPPRYRRALAAGSSSTRWSGAACSSAAIAIGALARRLQPTPERPTARTRC